MDISNRINSEKTFYDNFYAEGWEKQDRPIGEDIVPPNMGIYWDMVKSHVNGLKEKTPQPVVLDCGCGHGVLSVLLGQLGVRVIAVDISLNSTLITRNLARANNVDAGILPVVAAMENLPFKPGVFDSVLGTRVLHHVDIDNTSRELVRVIKPGTRAFFWECTEKNPVLRFARNNIRKILPAPKFGTAHEHPLTRREIATLGASFGSPAVLVKAPFYFFGLINQYISSRYREPLTELGKKLDALISAILPGLNDFSFHQILVLKKPSDKSNST